jgi:cell division protein FtsB
MVMKKNKIRLTPNRVWLMVFGLWMIFLSGAFAGIVGSPGIVQAIRLNGLLESKQTQLSLIEEGVLRLQAEMERLDKSRVAQEREIRRTLGYAAPDEIIFDFSRRERFGVL